jgi:hypothetical protein
LARGNAQEQTHSQTFSNYLCTNDELGNSNAEKGIQAFNTHAAEAKVEDLTEAKSS